MCNDWTPTDSMIENVAVEIVRKQGGASRINPVSVALQMDNARRYLEAAHDKIPEIIHGLINSQGDKT